MAESTIAPEVARATLGGDRGLRQALRKEMWQTQRLSKRFVSRQPTQTKSWSTPERAAAMSLEATQ
jgi:hypothetical protein